jgi:hypothetical protein
MTDTSAAQRPMLSAASLGAVEAAREDAARWVTDRLCELAPAPYERFGASARRVCYEDVCLQFDLLLSALEVGDPHPSHATYLEWLTVVLGSRRVSSGHAALSAMLLAQYLATRLPPEDMAERTSPEVVALSSALPQHLRVTRAITASLRARMGRSCPHLMVGGLASNQVPGMVRALDADVAFTDALQAAAYVVDELGSAA